MCAIKISFKRTTEPEKTKVKKKLLDIYQNNCSFKCVHAVIPLGVSITCMHITLKYIKLKGHATMNYSILFYFKTRSNVILYI